MTIKRYYICIITIIVNIVFANNLIHAQNSQPDTMMIRIESGGSVDFRINSMNKYEEGVEYQNWTRLAVYFIDEDDPGRSWDLEFKASTMFIIGDSGKQLDLDIISIEAGDGGGNTDLSAWMQPEKDLDSGYQLLVADAPQGGFNDNKIIITYRCGKGSKILLGEPAGYYVVDIEFKITAQ